MKFLKSLSFVLFFITLSTFSNAQVIGLRIGVNHTKMPMDHNTISPYTHSTSGGVNLHGGITFDFKINKLISIEPGLIFSKKKIRYEDGVAEPNTAFFYQSEYGLTYLNIPVPIKFNYKQDNITYYGFAGGYLDFGTKGEITIKQETTVFATFERHDVWPKTKEERRLEKLDYGTTFGIGIVISDFQIELFSNIGFVDMATSFDNITSAKNRTFGISFALRLGSHDTDFD